MLNGHGPIRLSSGWGYGSHHHSPSPAAVTYTKLTTRGPVSIGFGTVGVLTDSGPSNALGKVIMSGIGCSAGNGWLSATSTIRFANLRMNCEYSSRCRFNFLRYSKPSPVYVDPYSSPANWMRITRSGTGLRRGINVNGSIAVAVPPPCCRMYRSHRERNTLNSRPQYSRLK